MSLTQIEILLFGKKSETNRKKVRALIEEQGENPDFYSWRHGKFRGVCKVCGKNLKRGQTKYCSQSCSATDNNTKRKKKQKECKQCGKKLTKRGVFCSSQCAADYKSILKYRQILNGDASIMRSTYSPTRVVYKYIMQEQENKCAICGMINIWQNKPIKFIVDHIDGDASNNKRENLRCICPNCDSQLDTYKNTNSHRSTRTKRR